MLFKHAKLQANAHLCPVAVTESLEYKTFECILVYANDKLSLDRKYEVSVAAKKSDRNRHQSVRLKP